MLPLATVALVALLFTVVAWLERRATRKRRHARIVERLDRLTRR